MSKRETIEVRWDGDRFTIRLRRPESPRRELADACLCCSWPPDFAIRPDHFAKRTPCGADGTDRLAAGADRCGNGTDQGGRSAPGIAGAAIPGARGTLPGANGPVEEPPSGGESGIPGAGSTFPGAESRLAEAICRFSDASSGISLDYMLMAVDDSRLAGVASGVAQADSLSEPRPSGSDRAGPWHAKGNRSLTVAAQCR